MTRPALSLMLAIGLLAGCAGQGGNDPAIGDRTTASDRSRESEGGIGGTGAPSRQPLFAGEETEGGIGGTGIFGTVTAFGSIVVNGQTVDFSDEVTGSQAAIAGQELPLTVGSAVLVEARQSEAGWTADRVSLFLPVVGAVTLIDPSSARLEVMGTPITTDDDTEIVDRRDRDNGEALDLAELRPGDRLAISGLWKGGEVTASRIDRLRDRGPASLQGLLLKNGDEAIVGGTRLDAGCCPELDTPAYVSLIGTYRNGRFNVGRIDAGSGLLFSERVDRLIVEAFLARDPVGDGFHLSGFGIPADQSATIDTPPGVRSLFIGAYDDTFLIRRSIPLPDGQSGRADTLRALGDLAPSD